MKTIAQRVDELIKEGDQVHCLIIGCMGPILEVFNGSFIVSFPHRRGIYKRGSLHLNDKLNSPKIRLYHNKEKNRYEVVHRKKYIEKMTRGKTNVGAGLAKALSFSNGQPNYYTPEYHAEHCTSLARTSNEFSAVRWQTEQKSEQKFFGFRRMCQTFKKFYQFFPIRTPSLSGDNAPEQ